MEMDHYDVVPAIISEKIVAGAKKHPEEEDEG